MSLLALNARLPLIATNQRNARWDPVFTPLIRGKRLLVIGLGAMGRAAAAVGRTLGLEVHGISRSGKAVRGVLQVDRSERLLKAVAKADFVVIATPLTPDTRGLVSAEVLRAMKAGAGLINVGRAGVMDHDALVASLTEGRLSGAVIDVLPEEPLPAASPLWHVPNLLITPHVAADDLDGYMTGTMDLVSDNIRRHLAGKPPKNAVDRGAGY